MVQKYLIQKKWAAPEILRLLDLSVAPCIPPNLSCFLMLTFCACSLSILVPSIWNMFHLFNFHWIFKILAQLSLSPNAFHLFPAEALTINRHASWYLLKILQLQMNASLLSS